MTRSKKAIIAVIVAVVLTAMGFIADLLGISADPRIELLIKNAQNPFIIVTLILSMGCNGIFLLYILKQRNMRRDDSESLLNSAYADPRYIICPKRFYGEEERV